MELKKIILITIFILSVGCEKYKEAETFKSDLRLSENLSDFTTEMSDKDTVKILANLNMEWWMRHDELIITKRKGKIQLQTTVYEDTSLLEPLEYKWRVHKLQPITIENFNNEFENHFVQKIERSKKNFDKSRIYRIMTVNDTLTFGTKSLGDKGGEVKDYYEFMRGYYPENEEFPSWPIEVDKQVNAED